ncbi:MAG: hypothetical protein J6B64_00010 [Bacilli bacterium]|nr:hypothetical protein [Bacilli bacterium]MBP3635751.1 hypothetical protein [Bacilli bacterium]
MKKIYKILILLLLIVITLIVSFFTTTDNIAIFGNNTIIYYKDNKISEIKHVKRINPRYNFEKFNIYNGEKFEKGYINFIKGKDLQYADVYDSNYTKIYINPLIAYKGYLNFKIIKSSSMEEYSNDNINFIQKILIENNLTQDYTSLTKSVANDIIVYDVNNFALATDSYYRIMILVDGKGNYTIIDNSSLTQYELLNVKHYEFYGLVDIDLDNEYEIVLSSHNGDDSPIYYHFYNLDSNGNIEEIK